MRFINGKWDGTVAQIWIDGLTIIDLTAAFGAGREPDKTWCDANISNETWYGGSFTVNYGKRFHDSVLEVAAYHRVGVKAFNTTWTSSVEWAFEKTENLTEKRKVTNGRERTFTSVIEELALKRIAIMEG
ncbi:hypothetical protein FACS18949_12040 [Clostridia bacterium]|nr:hypothetical protein FACS18949_12040 [Clostridia bacterium]